ncbi:Ion transport protein-domain-containing protein [Mycena epipterygia]|nr:Ion transport protein-domain-containing protein [Mycena epipterygia]
MSLHAHSSSAVQIPASPRSLEPSPTRKRNSWGQDSDPFYTPQDDPWSNHTPRSNPRYGTPPADDSTSSLAGPSSLYGGDDDAARLTSREEDPSTARRRTLRYSASPSPLKKTGTAIKHVSQNLRRASVRVVNMASVVGHERLPDDKKDDDDHLPDLSQTLPIRGRTLGFLGPTNGLRLFCFNLLVYPWTEPIILLLIIFNAVVLTIQSSRSLTLSNPPTRVTGYFHSWEDYTLFVLFIGFTIEACARICVSGLLFDPESTSSLALRRSLALPTGEKPSTAPAPPETLALPFRLSITNAADQTRRNAPYLRHSWSRIDALAIVAFWASFALATFGVERGEHHIRVFRALSALRTARLLTITSGTTAILHSLKTAQPLLASVAYFVVFAMVIFSIIGVQAFKGSLRRTCVLNATLGEPPTDLDNQFCGGWIEPVSLNKTGYITLDGSISPDLKGYICPLGQTCREAGNPLDGVESFDTIYFAALQVIIVASANGWSPLMYSMIDSEYFIVSIFFILCVVVLNFWLINLFVAVITNTFSAIRSETKKSAFGATNLTPIVEHDDDDGWALSGRPPPRRANFAGIIVSYSRWFFVALALASLALQATRTPTITPGEERVLFFAELSITIAFDLEILLRIAAALPDWRGFLGFGKLAEETRSEKGVRGAGQNWLDMALAVITSVIQIPAIRHSAVYPWFTIFQLMRFYRVILVVPRMKPLLLAVFGNIYGLANMTLFLILVNFVAALVSVQFLRGDLDAGDTMNFGTLFNAFLAVYQVFSSENWTDVLYTTSNAEIPFGQSALTVLFIAAWMLFANFIVLQMFIAVINENFDVAEEAKKGKQASNYWELHRPQEGHVTWLRRLNPYRWIRASPVEVKVEALPANLILPMQKSLVQDYSVPRSDAQSVFEDSKPTGRGHYSSKSLTALQRLFAGETKGDIPMSTLRHGRSDTLAGGGGGNDPQDEETERHLELLAAVRNETTTTNEELNDALYERRAQKADFIRDHPSYDKTFWVFSQKNMLRKTCQKLVQPASGPRIFGTQQSPVFYPLFQVTLLLIVIGGIVVESIANPVYRRNYFSQHGLVRGAWFDIAESAFGLVFFVEFLIKIVADGFLFTPNAYVRSIWNLLDFVIMVGLLVNVTTGLIFVGGLSRLTRSLKALRALRLITLIDRMRTTFESLIISGALRILDAGILAILYMIPYAVWGLNIFNGKMNECNDTNVSGADTCINEYTNTVYGNAFGFVAPRVWENPAPSTVFSFDSFRSSLLILFEIVSLEGWVDVMGVATSITGENSQPETNAAQINAIFFLIYNLLGAVVILTLFVSIIIGNFSSKTGSAFLTAAQREWIDLQKLFKRQRPSKRPRTRPTWTVRAWCYDRAVNKNGWWSKAMTLVVVGHIIVLMTQTFSTQHVVDELRNDFFLVSTSIYIVDVLVRLFGLGYLSFRSNGWNVFDFCVAGGSFITTLIVRFGTIGFVTQQLQKLFLVCIAFKLVERTNSLNKLFKTAVASLPIIFSLLGLWFILFLFFGILFLEVFALTKWNSGESRSQNFSTMGSTLVMLTFFTTGEGWNQYMHDYAVVYPRCTNADSEENSDCGSAGWAFTLFIAWNLLSMYIFVNMFTGVVVENFSYVFQTSGSSKSITRAQMRSFKKVWAEFANPKTGYLERSRFVPFFGKLSGVFEARIYPAEFSIPNIQAMCKPSTDSQYAWPGRVVEGVDLAKLDKALKNIDYASIRKRRAVYSRLYHEASISHQHGRGMSFTDMLFLLAHHKLIVDRDALILKDLVVRTETNKLVTDLVNLDRVRSLLKTISHRRRFLRYKQQQLMALEPDIPSIIVDVMPATPPNTTKDISSGGYSTPSSPTPQRFFMPDVSLSSSTPRLQRSSRRTSDISMLSGDIGYKSRDSSISIEDPQQMLQAMQNSVWGDLMIEAEEEEKR